MNDKLTLWHVTPTSAVQDILQNGFLAGWGDNGFGVYLYADYAAAEDYLARGGWDGEADPKSLEIIEVQCNAWDVVDIDINPHWPDPQTYANIVFRPMDTERAWAPVRSLVSRDALENEKGQPMKQIESRSYRSGVQKVSVTVDIDIEAANISAESFAEQVKTRMDAFLRSGAATLDDQEISWQLRHEVGVCIENAGSEPDTTGFEP